ncbi:MAG TPA: PCP reductase family protein [Candidatus Tectomicrobia bacterium]|nr:PCP reductase family protein [Candidatus Tectomicrobia bacterium]
MKFLCLDCDEAMKLHSTEGPDEGSLTVTFRCPTCGFRVAMLTNPFETQMVRSLGVKVGGRAVPAEPFEHLRSSLASTRPDAFEGSAASGQAGTKGCPFAAALGGSEPAAPAAPTVTWTTEAEARLERIPSFIRPMARRSIERFAEGQGYAVVTETVMDEARAVFGM